MSGCVAAAAAGDDDDDDDADYELCSLTMFRYRLRSVT